MQPALCTRKQALHLRGATESLNYACSESISVDAPTKCSDPLPQAGCKQVSTNAVLSECTGSTALAHQQPLAFYAACPLQARKAGSTSALQKLLGLDAELLDR